MTSFPSWIIQKHATVLYAWLCVWQYNTCFLSIWSYVISQNAKAVHYLSLNPSRIIWIIWDMAFTQSRGLNKLWSIQHKKKTRRLLLGSFIAYWNPICSYATSKTNNGPISAIKNLVCRWSKTRNDLRHNLQPKHSATSTSKFDCCKTREEYGYN